MNLIVGATGPLGEICRPFAEQGKSVRTLTRHTSHPEKVARLAGLGVEVMRADLKERASLHCGNTRPLSNEW